MTLELCPRSTHQRNASVYNFWLRYHDLKDIRMTPWAEFLLSQSVNRFCFGNHFLLTNLRSAQNQSDPTKKYLFANNMKFQTSALLLAILAAFCNAEFTRGGEATSRELKRKRAEKPGKPAKTFPFTNANNQAIGKNCKIAGDETACLDMVYFLVATEGLEISDDWCGCEWSGSKCKAVEKANDEDECEERRDLKWKPKGKPAGKPGKPGKPTGKPGKPVKTFPFTNARGEAIGKNCKTASSEELCDTMVQFLTDEENLGMTLSDDWCGCEWDGSACEAIEEEECEDRRDLKKGGKPIKKKGKPQKTFPFTNKKHGTAIGKNCAYASSELECSGIVTYLLKAGLTLSDDWCGCTWDDEEGCESVDKSDLGISDDDACPSS